MSVTVERQIGFYFLFFFSSKIQLYWWKLVNIINAIVRNYPKSFNTLNFTFLNNTLQRSCTTEREEGGAKENKSSVLFQ